MLEGSQNLRATRKECHAQNKQMPAVEYISDTEEIVKTSCSLSQYHGAIAFKLSERSPLPQALSAKDLPVGRTRIWNGHSIRRIICHAVESEEDSAPESISDIDY